jgi:SAM-dependent methyltransferase
MAARAGVDGRKVAVMDADALGFPSRAFDAVASNFALTYFTDPQRVLAECRRVLRPGGSFGLVVHDGWWWQDDARWAWHVRLVRELGNERAMTERRFSNPNAIRALIEEASFTEVEATIERFVLRWADAGQWWEWCWSQGYREVLEAFDSITLDEYRAACFAYLAFGPVDGNLPVILIRANAPT